MERLEPSGTEPVEGAGTPPRDLAESLRRTVMAIAREWGDDPQDLTDPSDDEHDRLERAIESAKERKSELSAVDGRVAVFSNDFFIRWCHCARLLHEWLLKLPAHLIPPPPL